MKAITCYSTKNKKGLTNKRVDNNKLMNFTRLPIPDVILCEPKLIGDDRCYFSETFRKGQLDAFIGHQINFCQDNESKSSYGVLKGLH
jgi:dTDP-4-dehydrorhamnose 3,5-epimerase